MKVIFNKGRYRAARAAKKGGTGSFVWKWVGSQYKVENM